MKYSLIYFQLDYERNKLIDIEINDGAIINRVCFSLCISIYQ